MYRIAGPRLNDNHDIDGWHKLRKLNNVYKGLCCVLTLTASSVIGFDLYIIGHRVHPYFKKADGRYHDMGFFKVCVLHSIGTSQSTARAGSARNLYGSVRTHILKSLSLIHI